MDSTSEINLVRLICTQRIAALGTLREGGPLVSMVLYIADEHCASFFIHISRLAQHTQDILLDPQVSLMIAEPDTGTQDPQTLARISIRGEAVEVPLTAGDYVAIKARYLNRYPQTNINFELSDFSLYRIQPRAARYVAGFGKIFNLNAEHLMRAAAACIHHQ